MHHPQLKASVDAGWNAGLSVGGMDLRCANGSVALLDTEPAPSPPITTAGWNTRRGGVLGPAANAGLTTLSTPPPGPRSTASAGWNAAFFGWKCSAAVNEGAGAATPAPPAIGPGEVLMPVAGWNDDLGGGRSISAIEMGPAAEVEGG